MLKALEKTHQQAEPAASSVLLDQVAMLLCCDPIVRSGEQVASNAMSAAAWQVWSLLGDRRMFDRTAVDGIRAELTWLTESLGPLSRSINAQGSARGSAQPSTQGSAQGAAYEAAYDTALSALESDRYFRLVAGLQQFCSAPPVRQPRARHLYSRHHFYRG